MFFLFPTGTFVVAEEHQMQDSSKTKHELIEELSILKEKIKKLEKSDSPSIGQDITEHKRTEMLLRASEERFRSLVETTSDWIWETDAQGVYTYASPKVKDILGYASSEIVGKKPSDLMPPAEAERVAKIMFQYFEEAKPFIEFENLNIHKDGRMVVLETSGVPIVDENGHLTGYRGIDRDVTERKRAEEELEESRKQMASIIEFLPDATGVIDKEGKVIAWNRAMEVMTGVKKEDMIGKGNHEYSLPFYGDRRKVLIDLALRPNREMEKQYTTIHRTDDILFGETFTPNLPSGNIHVSATASVLRDNNGEITAAIECIRDNTERKRLEERLNRAEKMESLGTLAGGVAHDLNNVLGVLVGYSELLRDELPENSTMRRYADNIVQSSVRGAAIINDLLTLARRGVTISEVVDLNKLVFNYLRTPEFEKLKSYHPEVKIRTHLEDNLLNIKGSPVHLGKTIMNLVSNAAEAISGQGEVTIKTENRYLEHPLYGYEEMKEGDYVVLKVSDTGTGISGNDIKKIFEPFYTKKVMGRSGTGLGLAVVWGTVKDHHGYIDILSEEGEGSTFILYFPVTREKQEQVEEAISPVTYRSRGESILVVDDVKEQRKLTISMLGKLGYQVEAVASGEEAIEYLKNKKADLIILDMIMDPGIDGTETYRRILEINPVQKAVIVSGFSETDRVRNAQEMGAGAFVQKPFILENIGIAIRKELDRK
jgi:PAS domain S-box-containing protein